MHRPKRTIPLALACALVAALSGCGGDEAADDGAAATDTAAAARTAEAGGGRCTPPPPVPFDTTSGQPWAPVAAYLATRGWTPAGQKVPVRLCNGQGCTVVASIQSDTATYCLANAGRDPQLRMLGMVTAVSNANAPALGFTAQNTDRTVYLLSRAGRAYALYRNDTTTQWVPTTATSGWLFNFCDDNQSHSSAQAQWKNYDTGRPVPDSVRDTTVVGGKAGDDPTELATGWMACVSGCCRFYGSPPPDDDMGADPDTLKGGQQGQGVGRPPVCPDTIP